MTCTAEIAFWLPTLAPPPHRSHTSTHSVHAASSQSAQIYWQVANVDTPDLPRVYPEAYSPHVVGMLWSTLAQMQTWFGAEAWKVYGIQVRDGCVCFLSFVRDSSIVVLYFVYTDWRGSVQKLGWKFMEFRCKGH